MNFLVIFFFFFINFLNADNFLSTDLNLSNKDFEIVDDFINYKSINIQNIENNSVKSAIVLLNIFKNSNNIPKENILSYLDLELLHKLMDCNPISFYVFEILFNYYKHNSKMKNEVVNRYFMGKNSLFLDLKGLYFLKEQKYENKKIIHKIVNTILERYYLQNIDQINDLITNFSEFIIKDSIYKQFQISLLNKNIKNANFCLKFLNKNLKEYKIAKQEIEFFYLINKKKININKILKYSGLSQYIDFSILQNTTDSIIQLNILKNLNEITLMPDLWIKKQNKIVRELIINNNTNDHRLAYKIMNLNKFLSLNEYHIQQWMLGFIALLIGDRDMSEKHFLSYANTAMYVQSKARGNYWLAIVNDRKNEHENAFEYRKKAAKYPLSFYGQLAIEDLGIDLNKSIDNFLQNLDEIANKNSNELNQNPIFIAAYLANKMNNQNLSLSIINFFFQTEEDLNSSMKALKIIEKEFSTSFARGIGRTATRFNICLKNISYPSLKDVENNFIRAIIRQESGFHTNAISNKNAHGIMQLLPSTAKQVAKLLNINYDATSLLTDSLYNITLGSKYMDNCLSRFGNHKVYGLICYNAGPARVELWKKRYGDLLQVKTRPEIAKWVEMIPIDETRDYVQKIIETEIVYEMIRN